MVVQGPSGPRFTRRPAPLRFRAEPIPLEFVGPTRADRGKTAPPEALERGCEDLEEAPAIGVVAVNRAALVPTGRYVVDPVSDFEPQWSGHAREGTQAPSASTNVCRIDRERCTDQDLTPVARLPRPPPERSRAAASLNSLVPRERLARGSSGRSSGAADQARFYRLGCCKLLLACGRSRWGVRASGSSI